LYFLENIFKFYQLDNINICKFNKCFDSDKILFGILVLNVYNCNYFQNI